MTGFDPDAAPFQKPMFAAMRWPDFGMEAPGIGQAAPGAQLNFVQPEQNTKRIDSSVKFVSPPKVEISVSKLIELNVIMHIGAVPLGWLCNNTRRNSRRGWFHGKCRWRRTGRYTGGSGYVYFFMREPNRRKGGALTEVVAVPGCPIAHSLDRFRTNRDYGGLYLWAIAPGYDRPWASS